MHPGLRTLIYLGLVVAYSAAEESQSTNVTAAEATNVTAAEATNVAAAEATNVTAAEVTNGQPKTEPELPSINAITVSQTVTTTSIPNQAVSPVAQPETSTSTVTTITVSRKITTATENQTVPTTNEENQKVSPKPEQDTSSVVPLQIYTIELQPSSSTESTIELQPSSSTESSKTSTPVSNITPLATENVRNVTSNEIVFNISHSASPGMNSVTAETEIPDDIDTSAIYLKFTGNCEDENHLSQNMDFVEFKKKDTDICQLTLKVVPVENREDVFKQLRPLIGKFSMYHDGERMTLTEMEASFEYFVTNDTNDDDNWRFVKGLSYNEFVAYVVIGCSFGVLLLTALCLLCIKCCRCGKKDELKDIPHLTLKLEDYALTRIPRPNTLYCETSKMPIVSDDSSSVSVQGLARSTNGQEDCARMSRAYDTGVIPMDEYEYDGHTHYATPGFRNGAPNGKEMRTFRVKNDSPTKHAEMEERVSYNYDSLGTNSTEKLARDFYRRQASACGEENPNFKT